MDQSEKDFFISYANADAAWAEWIAWQLEAAQYSTVLQAWDFLPGSNFVHQIDRASKVAKRTIAVVSGAYIERLFTQSEWTAAFARDPLGTSGTLLPVRVQDCNVMGLLAPITYIDLVGENEACARKKLLDGVGGRRAKPFSSPLFPGELSPSLFPGRRSGKVSSMSTLVTRSFVCAKLTASGFLDLEVPDNPYSGTFDPTDHEGQLLRSRIFVTVYLPSPGIMNGSVGAIPAAAICTLEPEEIVKTMERLCPNFAKLLEGKAGDIKEDVKEKLLGAMAYALRDSFVAAVTIPSIVLGVGRRKPELGYHAMMDLFFFPMVEMHRRMGFKECRAWMSDVNTTEVKKNNAILKIAKQGLKALFPGRCGSVGLVSGNQFWQPFTDMAKLLTWVVTVYFSGDDIRWLILFREQLETHRID